MTQRPSKSGCQSHFGAKCASQPPETAGDMQAPPNHKQDETNSPAPSRESALRARALFITACLLIPAGMASVGFYAFEAWSVAGAADQSIAFWALPFLLGGLLLTVFGVMLLVFWRLLAKAERER